MSLIKDKHNIAFHENFDKLCESKGQSISVYIKLDSRVLCTWCLFDTVTGRSSGQPYIDTEIYQDLILSSGYPHGVFWLSQWLEVNTPRDWSTHPSYVGDVTCPECNGVGYTENYSVITVDNIMVDENIIEVEYAGKKGKVLAGIIGIYGRISDILSDPTSGKFETIFDHALAVNIDGTFYRLLHITKIGLKDWYIYEAYLGKIDNRYFNNT